MRMAAALVLALVSCSPGVDVVARAIDAGDAGDAEVPDAGDGSTKAMTCDDDEPMTIATSSSIYRYEVSNRTKPMHFPTPCFGGPISAIAVDRRHRVWAASGGELAVFDPNTHECEPSKATVSPTAMAFVWDPADESEKLYAMVAGVLVVFNPSTLARTPVAKVDAARVRALTGTSDGRLLAFSEELPIIFEVNLRDASLTPYGEVGRPELGPFVGGLVGAQGLLLVFGVEIYRHDSPKDVTLIDAIAGVDSNIVGVSTAPCWRPPK